MTGKVSFSFSSNLWQHSASGGWHFVSLPKNLATEIRSYFKWQEEGWGRMKATVFLESLTWKTSIWFDKKHDTYLLPIKSDVRKKLNLKINDELFLKILI